MADKNLPFQLASNMLYLSYNKKRIEIVDEIIDRLKNAQQMDLLPVAYMLASLVFEKGNDREWLQRRFAMFEEILEETWAYQEILDKGLKKGLEKGLQEGLQEGRVEEGQEIVMTFIEQFFPALTPLAKQKVHAIKDAKALQQIVLTMLRMQIEQEVEAYPLSLKGDITK